MWGLREDKHKATKARVVDEALRLFSKYGFEPTSMECIAEASDISPSTLYRTFPSKDLIVLSGFTSDAEICADAFAAADPNVPIERSLGSALLTGMRVGDQRPERTELLRHILDDTPSLRARLWDLLGTERERLGRTLAKRLSLPGK